MQQVRTKKGAMQNTPKNGPDDKKDHPPSRKA